MNATRALLDQLMGPNRNRRGGDSNGPSARWSDKNVCPWFLCDFCPHDLFTNTKEDLGVCPKIHSDPLKEEFLKQSEDTINRYKMKYLRYLQGLQVRGRQRVSRAQERLKMQAPNHFGDPELRRRTKEIERLGEELRGLEKEVEELGEQGKVQEAQETLQKQEKMKMKLHNLKEQHSLRSSQLEARVKPFVVCDVCGGFIVDENPSSSRRVVAHKAGRMHQGFAKIFAKVEELEESLKDVIIADSEERSNSRERHRRRRDTGDRDRSRDRSRGRRDRDRGGSGRDRERRRRESSRRHRSRSYERRRRRH